MSVLKEGFGCSDKELFEKCEFDLLTRKALGLELLTDVTPSIDTYYLFRRRIYEYQEGIGIDLVLRADCRPSGTPSQYIRQERPYEPVSPQKQEEQAREYLTEDSSKIVYRSNSETLQDNLARIGNFIMEMPTAFPATDSLQNPNDPDATYHNKNNQKVQGYLTNITETVEKGKPDIITSVQVETAVFADCHFLQEAVENSERVTGSTIEELYADGAYQSPDNRAFAKNHNNMQLKTGKMQGGCRWELISHDEDGLTVTQL